MDAALYAIIQNLGVIEKQLETTPNDPALYCDYIFVWVHRNVLQRLSRYAAMHKLTLRAVERYFQVRIRAASTISKAEYDKDKAAISESLLDFYEQERRTADSTRNMLKQLLKQ